VGNFLQWHHNLGLLFGESLPIRLQLLAILAGIILLLLVAGQRCWRDWLAWSGPEPVLAFPLAYLAIGVAAVAVFASATEFRVFHELIPAFILLVEALNVPVRSGAPA
jgi:hypothetical protein